MLVELAVGDAYGGAFEFTSSEFVKQHNDLSGYQDHPKWKDQNKAGCYTDDTQMTIAMVEALLSGQPLSKKLLADKIVAAFKRDPRKSYARRFGKFLEDVKDADEFLAEISPKSDKSGAAMRASPFGLFADVKEVLDKSKFQAMLTHDTPDGINAAQAASLMVHYFAYNLGKKGDLAAFIGKHLPNDWTSPWIGKIGPKGWQSVKAAITVIQDSNSLSGILQRGVAFGGDVDTACTIAMAAASFADDITQDIPNQLITGLEDGQFGRKYLQKLDKQLLGLFDLGKPSNVWDIL